MPYSINTRSGGLVETKYYQDRLHGQALYLHIDQSTNTNNGEGDAAIMMTNQEVKDLIYLLNDYINFTEGAPHVVLAAPLLHPDVKITFKGKKVEKIAENINPYIQIEDLTPGDNVIDAENYIESVGSLIKNAIESNKEKE
jgi:hypothetical protein